MSLERVSPKAQPTVPEMPERLGKYEILARLGQGAMGVVYHAHDPLLERDVALKVMLAQVAQDPEQRLRFEREARAVARMMHPNVVTVFDLGYHTDGAPYIAMELLRGHDLLQLLRQGPTLSLDRKLAITLQVLEGLGHAHAAGIVHRDIKPANIFLPDEGTAKIMDFGVARFTMSSLTSTGVVVGTADYMSPEQVNGARVDGRSDLFSAGAMLAELLTGHRPFHGESLVTILFKITHEEPRLELPPGPEHLALLPVLKKALAKDVAHRYQTAAEFAEALQEYVAASSAKVSAGAEPISAALADTSSGRTTGGRTQETIDFGPIVLHLDFAAEPPAPAKPVAVAPPADPTPVFRLMREIHERSKSGHLHLLHGRSRRSLRFLEGQILHGTSDARGEHLGDVLVRYGRLRQADLDQAVEVVLRDRRRLGGVLLTMGLLDRAGLDEAVGLHAREILFDAMGRGDGSFTFEESGPDPLGPDDAASNLSTLEIILEAARRVQDPDVVRRVLRNLDQVPVVARDAFNRFRNIALTPADGFLLSRIDGKSVARDLFKLIPLPTEDVERSLFSLLSSGVVEYRTAAAEPALPPPRLVSRPAPLPIPPTPAPPVAATPAFAPSHPTGASEARLDLEVEKARREADDKAVEATRTLIVEALEGLEAKNLFDFIGVSRAATDLQVREAYFRMAKHFHPDTRLDPRLSDLQDKRHAVFLRLGEAYEALRTPASRARYAASLGAVQGGPPDEPPISDAAHEAWLAGESLVAAEEHHREGRYWDAIQLLESTIPRLEGGLKVRARVALARAQMKNPNWVKRAEEALHALLQQHPQSTDALLALAELYRSTQMRSRALAMYRRVLEIDRDNKDAMAGARFLGSQETQPPDTGKLLKKLFGNKP